MMPFVFAAMLIGVVLARRFTVVALIPAMTFAIIIAGAAAVGGGAFGTTMIELAAFLICLQVGYLGGAAVRFSLFDGITQQPVETGAY
jgi:hypothetical protein